MKTTRNKTGIIVILLSVIQFLACEESIPEHNHPTSENSHETQDTVFDEKKAELKRLQVFQNYLNTFSKAVDEAEAAIAKGEEGGFRIEKFTNRIFTLDVRITYIDWDRQTFSANVIETNANLRIDVDENSMEIVESTIVKGEKYLLKVKIIDIEKDVRFGLWIDEPRFQITCQLII